MYCEGKVSKVGLNWVSIKALNISLTNTGYTQKNGAVLKVNNKFISHLTRAELSDTASLSFFTGMYEYFASFNRAGLDVLRNWEKLPSPFGHPVHRI
jgi:hypothetical protein